MQACDMEFQTNHQSGLVSALRIKLPNHGVLCILSIGSINSKLPDQHQAITWIHKTFFQQNQPYFGSTELNILL